MTSEVRSEADGSFNTEHIDRSVLVVGESLVDIIVDYDGAISKAPGGSPLNVATGLGRLGSTVELLTAIGSDDHGKTIVRHLADSHVGLLNGVGIMTCLSTSTTRAQLDPNKAATYTLDVSWPAVNMPSIDKYSLVHTGSLALWVQPGAAAVAGLLRSIGDTALVSLDANIRADAVGGEVDPRQHLEPLFQHAHVVKLSDEDARHLYPTWDTDAVLSHILTLGPALVVMTCGMDGSTLASKRHRVFVPAIPARVVDTVGAGDAYMSGLLHGLLVSAVPADGLARLSFRDIEKLGELASLVAGLTVARRGANPPRAHEVHSLLSEVSLSRLAGPPGRSGPA